MSTIVTARLVLRPITTEEVSAVLIGRRRSDWAADFPAEGDQVIAGLLARSGLHADDDARRFGHRLVVERDTSTVVGGAGFFGPPQEGEVEIGYGIVPTRQRRGYATEVVQAMVADVFQLDRVLTVTANVDLDNPARYVSSRNPAWRCASRIKNKPRTTSVGGLACDEYIRCARDG